MSLFVTNSTLQNIVFFYREDVEDGKQPLLRSVPIGSGKQVEIGAGLKPRHAAKIIAQLEAFGARDAAEVHKAIKKFHGLLYRYEAPVSEDEIMLGHDSVKETLNDRSAQQAINSALAADRVANPVKGQRRTRRTAVTVEQLVPPGSRPTGDETNFTLEVDADQGAGELRTRA
jgi:hypothetical protein